MADKKVILIQETCECVRDLYQSLFLLISPDIELHMTDCLADSIAFIAQRGLPALVVVDCCRAVSSEDPTRFNNNDEGLELIRYLRASTAGLPKPWIALTTTRDIKNLPEAVFSLLGEKASLHQKPFANSDLVYVACSVLELPLPHNFRR